MDLSDELKDRLKDLGLAISAALSDSPDIGEAIAHIKESGYDLVLVLEATIGLSRHREDTLRVTLPESLRKNDSGEIKLKMTTSDREFLQALRIKIDESGSPEMPNPLNGKSA